MALKRIPTAIWYSPWECLHNRIPDIERSYITEIINICMGVAPWLRTWDTWCFGIHHIYVESQPDITSSIDAYSGRILVECGNISTKCRKRSSHRHESGSSPKLTLRQSICIDAALGNCRHGCEHHCRYQYWLFHNLKSHKFCVEQIEPDSVRLNSTTAIPSHINVRGVLRCCRAMSLLLRTLRHASPTMNR